MSEVMETLEWPRRLETTTMFWPVCRATDAWKWRRLWTVILGNPHAPAEGLNGAGELERVNPAAALVGEDAVAIMVGAAHGVLDAVLLGAVLGEDVGGALVEIDDAARVVRLGRFDEQLGSRGNERRLDGDVRAVEVDVVPLEGEGLTASEAGVCDEVDGRMEVVSLVAGKIERAPDRRDVRGCDLAAGARRRGDEGRGIAVNDLHAQGVFEGAGEDGVDRLDGGGRLARCDEARFQSLDLCRRDLGKPRCGRGRE